MSLHYDLPEDSVLIQELLLKTKTIAEERDEARAEVERLRSEVERLTEDRTETMVSEPPERSYTERAHLLFSMSDFPESQLTNKLLVLLIEMLDETRRD